MTKKNPDAYITLDQFRQLAGRFQAKIDFIKTKLAKYNLVEDSCRLDFISDVISLLDTPCDHFLSKEDMSKPLAHHCEQLDFFDKAVC